MNKYLKFADIFYIHIQLGLFGTSTKQQKIYVPIKLTKPPFVGHNMEILTELKPCRGAKLCKAKRMQPCLGSRSGCRYVYTHIHKHAYIYIYKKTSTCTQVFNIRVQTYTMCFLVKIGCDLNIKFFKKMFVTKVVPFKDCSLQL